MLTEQRKEFLLARLRKDGRLVAKDLSDELGLSEDTIRRDLRELAALGLMTRVHGGALPASPTVANLEMRRGMALGEKQKLGSAAARLVQKGRRIFIDGGTTHIELVRNIPLSLQFTVITHSPPIAAALEAHSAEVIVVGGVLYHHSMVAVGAAAMDMISRINIDLAFVGATGFHQKLGLTTGSFEEATIKRAIIAKAAESAVLLTSEKIGAASAHAICSVNDISTLIVPRNAKNLRFSGRGPEVLRA